VKRVVITHCGSQIVAGDARRAGRWVRDTARILGITAAIARDGMVVELSGQAT
jgi:hypothetical protein